MMDIAVTNLGVQSVGDNSDDSAQGPVEVGADSVALMEKTLGSPPPLPTQSMVAPQPMMMSLDEIINRANAAMNLTKQLTKGVSKLTEERKKLTEDINKTTESVKKAIEDSKKIKKAVEGSKKTAE